MMLKLTIVAGLLAVSNAAAPSFNCQQLIFKINDPNTPVSSINSTLPEVRGLNKAIVTDACVRGIQFALSRKLGGQAQADVALSTKMGNLLKYHAEKNRPPIGSMKGWSVEHIKGYLNKKDTHEETVCSGLTATQIDELASDKKLASLVRPTCFRHFSHGVNFGKKGITKFRDDILSMWDGRLKHDSWYTMTKEQLNKYQSHPDLKPNRCAASFHMEKLTVPLFKQVPHDCLCKWLELNDSGIFLTDKQLKALTLEQLKKCSDDAIANGFQNLTGADKWKLVSADIVNHFLSKPELAGLVEHTAIKSSSKTNAEAFAFMKQESQLKLLELAKELPDDIFSQIFPSSVDNWDNSSIIKTSSKKACSKLQCFNLIKDHKNAKAMMASLKPYHCMDKKFDDLKEAWTFGQYLTRECYKEIDDANSLNDFTDLHEHVFQYVSQALVKEDFKDQGWQQHAEEYIQEKGKKNFVSVWRGVLRNPKICRTIITEKVFKKLRKEKLTQAISAFSSQCSRALPFFENLPAEEIKIFGPDVYTEFTKADKSKISFAKSTNEQISRISANVVDIADHYATQVSAEDVAGYSTDVFAILHESWFRAFPEDTYSGITAAQFGVVPAEKTVNITAAKIRKLAPATGNALTPEQVASIGSATAAEKEVLEALGAFTLSEDSQKAYKSRLEAAGNSAVSLAGAGLISLAAGLALLTPLL